MRKFIRSDYTFIKRLEKLKQKYLNQSNIILSSNSRMYLKIDGWIDDIKEDMRLRVLEEISSSDVWKMEYECIFKKQ